MAISAQRINKKALEFLRGSNMNRRLFDHALKHAHYLERYKNGEVRKIVGMLNELVIPDLTDLLARKLPKIVETAAPATLRESKRLRDLILATNTIMQGGIEQIGETFIGDMKEFALLEARWQKAAFDTISPIELNFVMPNVGTLQSIVVSRPIHGQFIRDIFDGISNKAVGDIRTQLNIGLAAGETVQQMTKRVIGDSTPTAALRRQAEAVVRTTATHVSAETRKETFNANDDIIKGMQFVATLDDRTTPICIANDGKIIPLGEPGPSPPLHFNCRSTLVPVMKSFKELGVTDLKELDPSTRASVGDVFTGQVSEKLSYGDWLREQGKEFVQDVMQSKERAELFLDNKISIDKFVNDKGRWMSIDDLRKMVAQN